MAALESANLMLLLLNVLFFVPATLIGLYGVYIVLRLLGLIVRRPRF